MCLGGAGPIECVRPAVSDVVSLGLVEACLSVYDGDDCADKQSPDQKADQAQRRWSALRSGSPAKTRGSDRVRLIDWTMLMGGRGSV